MCIGGGGGGGSGPLIASGYDAQQAPEVANPNKDQLQITKEENRSNKGNQASPKGGLLPHTEYGLGPQSSKY